MRVLEMARHRATYLSDAAEEEGLTYTESEHSSKSWSRRSSPQRDYWRLGRVRTRLVCEIPVCLFQPARRALGNPGGLRLYTDAADMDLVVLIDDPSAGLESSHLVQMIGDLLQRVRLALAECK